MCSKFEIILTKYEDVMLNSQNTLKTQKFMVFTQKVRAHYDPNLKALAQGLIVKKAKKRNVELSEPSPLPPPVK